MWNRIAAIALVALFLNGCGGKRPSAPYPPDQTPITVKSLAFAESAAIPKQFTCDGENFSPPITWEGPRNGTVAWALIMEDPDAPEGIWSHWVVANLPSAASDLAAHQPLTPELANGRQGLNDFKRIGYGGPCPPGGTHHYVFRVFAVDAVLNLPPTFDRQQLLDALKGHLVAEGKLTGTYSR
jgi:Raf kinase inhibitor-like YbhB/YbcL family protein